MDEHVAAVAALADATRRSVYDLVVSSGERIGRDRVAQRLGIGRTLAAFHLDKLAEAGLLEFGFERGPAGGRPAKLYSRSQTQVAVTLPPRSYMEAAEILADAVEEAGADQTVQRIAERRGLAEKRPDMWEALREHGYEPHDDQGAIELRNCPFHHLAEHFPPLVCGMNLALLTGMAKGGDWMVTPKMQPAQGRCCVVLERA